MLKQICPVSFCSKADVTAGKIVEIVQGAFFDHARRPRQVLLVGLKEELDGALERLAIVGEILGEQKPRGRVDIVAAHVRETGVLRDESLPGGQMVFIRCLRHLVGVDVETESHGRAGKIALQDGDDPCETAPGRGQELLAGAGLEGPVVFGLQGLRVGQQKQLVLRDHVPSLFDVVSPPRKLFRHEGRCEKFQPGRLRTLVQGASPLDRFRVVNADGVFRFIVC